MKTNPYSQLLDSNQPRFLAFQLQQQQQQQSENRQQTAAWEQSGPQCIDKNLQNPNTAVSFDIQHSLQSDGGITNKNSFIHTIMTIYIYEYVIQLFFMWIFVMLGEKIILKFAYAFSIVFPLAIIIPILTLNFKALQQRPASAIVVIAYEIVYLVLMMSLVALGFTKITKPRTKEGPLFGDISYNFLLAVFVGFNLFFNLLGILQLFLQMISMQIFGNDFTLTKFRIGGSIISLICALPYVMEGYIFAIIFCSGMLFTFWFSFGLWKVMDKKYGLNQNQSAFGSLAVFIFMVWPCA